MFACGVDFLLRLKPEALLPLAQQYAQLADPAPLKIGIHIRVGDQQLVRIGQLRREVTMYTIHQEYTALLKGLQPP
jgi:hypothetical protein